MQEGVLLVPRATCDPPNDGLEPTRAQLEVAGRIAPDVMAIDGSSKARRFLEWWNDCLNDVGTEGRESPYWSAEGENWARRLLELAPARFALGVLTDPGCNVSAWNLDRRSLDKTTEGDVVVDGKSPLRFMSFEGYQPNRPHRLSPASSRIRLSREPVLKELSLRYRQELLAAGWHDVSSQVPLGHHLAPGVVFDETMAALLEEARFAGHQVGDVLSNDGTASFLAWLREPPWPGAPAGVGRYVFRRVMRDRPDVLAACPDLDATDRDEFVEWCQTVGVRELDIPSRLLPLQNSEPEAAGHAPPAVGSLRPRWPRWKPRASSRVPPAQNEHARADNCGLLGVRVTGYLGHVLGLGSGARGYIRALKAAGVPVTTVSVPLARREATAQVSSGYGQASYEDLVAADDYAFELLCVNPDELRHLVHQGGDAYLQRPRIGVWAWELDTIPSGWSAAFELIDEIWVYSHFMVDNLSAQSPVPVVALPPAIRVPEHQPPVRLGVPDGYLFLFAFDYLSTIQRKNPVGLIDAFKRAFAPGEGPRLLIKTFNAPLRPLAQEEVLWAAGDRPDIHVVDRSLTSEERDGVMAACDCYVSLHRSEAFGLTLCEAMALGKPVIATRYSGNLDFMNDDNSFLVDYELTSVGADCEIYPASGRWAEPDVDRAAELMRRVYDHADEAAALGARARDDISRTLSPESTGNAMRQRLEKWAHGARLPAIRR